MLIGQPRDVDQLSRVSARWDQPTSGLEVAKFPREGMVLAPLARKQRI